MSQFKILIGLTGSIACYKTAHVISRLVQLGHEVEVIATPAALQFLGAATIEGLTGRPVHSDLWQRGQHMAHIDLGRWADAFLIAPATANHLNKFAQGAADDLLTTTYLAFEKHKPLFMAPAMNSEMLSHTTTQESLQKLAQRGHFLLATGQGTLACGEKGDGKMAEPEHILETLLNYLSGKRDKKLLITYGGTQEPIDGVRVLTNTSTGQTGAALAAALAPHFDVHVLRAQNAVPGPQHIPQQTFTSYADLDTKLKSQLAHTKFDGVIHLAAVSDYRVNKVSIQGHTHVVSNDQKLPSTANELTLHLERTEKIVNKLKDYAHDPSLKVVAFKLTKTNDAQERMDAVLGLLKSKNVDFVVHNDLNEISMDRSRHPFILYGRNDEIQKANHAQALAQVLKEIFYSGAHA